jgi:hypothetical protein
VVQARCSGALVWPPPPPRSTGADRAPVLRVRTKQRRCWIASGGAILSGDHGQQEKRRPQQQQQQQEQQEEGEEEEEGLQCRRWLPGGASTASQAHDHPGPLLRSWLLCAPPRETPAATTHPRRACRSCGIARARLGPAVCMHSPGAVVASRSRWPIGPQHAPVLAPFGAVPPCNYKWWRSVSLQARASVTAVQIDL